MSIAYDATSGGNGTGTSLTYAHTCSTGDDRILFVGINITDNTDSVTGVTYAGSAMTLVNKRSGTNAFLYLYYIIAPATGANNVVVSTSASKQIVAVGSSYTGAAQTGQPDSSATVKNTSGTSLVLQTTVVASNCWLVCIKAETAPNTLTNGSIRTGQINGTANGDSNATVGTGSQNLTWTHDEHSAGGIIASFAPASSGFLAFM